MKNKIQLAIEALENDDSLMRFEKVAVAVAMLKETHSEIPKEVSTGPVPVIGADMKDEFESLKNKFYGEVSAIEEKIDSMHVKLLSAEKAVYGQNQA